MGSSITQVYYCYPPDKQQEVIAKFVEYGAYQLPNPKFAQKVRKEICKEIGDSKFCIIIDESRDISKKEQWLLS